MQIIETQTVTATNGETVSIKGETICIHGDGKNALEFAQIINHKLTENGIKISSISSVIFGAAYTSVSFLKSFHTKIEKRNNLLIIAFIIFRQSFFYLSVSRLKS